MRNILIIGLLLLGLSSCDDFLDRDPSAVLLRRKFFRKYKLYLILTSLSMVKLLIRRKVL